MPDAALCKELVDLYFRYIHVTFHNLFHRPSFEAVVEDGSIPKILLFGIFSLAARFSSNRYFGEICPHERGRPYAKEAERLLDLHKTCLTTIQACVLLGAVQVVEMDSATESVFYTIACRMALILSLYDAPAETRIGQDINLRGNYLVTSIIPHTVLPTYFFLPSTAVWWTVVATDTWSSTALGLPRAIQPRYDIPMPMDERVFARLNSVEPSVSKLARVSDAEHRTAESSESLIAQMIMLNRILYDINTFNASVVSGTTPDTDIQEPVAELATALESWQQQLPPVMRNTPSNLSYWANQGCAPSFVVLHINFNHLGQLLFYRFLHHSLNSDMLSSQTGLAGLYAQKCRDHAASLCELIYRAREQVETEVLYPLVGHILVIASTVHLYMLLFSSDDAEIVVAKTRLEKNFQIITALQAYWPSLEASFSRLAAFHKACLRSKDSSFRLDQWMLRFLVEFARPVGERDYGTDGGSQELRSLVGSS